MGNCSRASGQDKKPDLEIFRREKKKRRMSRKGLCDVHPRWDKNFRMILKGNIFPAML